MTRHNSHRKKKLVFLALYLAIFLPHVLFLFWGSWKISDLSGNEAQTSEINGNTSLIGTFFNDPDYIIATIGRIEAFIFQWSLSFIGILCFVAFFWKVLMPFRAAVKKYTTDLLKP